jgi:hypothetical protein
MNAFPKLLRFPQMLGLINLRLTVGITAVSGKDHNLCHGSQAQGCGPDQFTESFLTSETQAQASS